MVRISKAKHTTRRKKWTAKDRLAAYLAYIFTAVILLSFFILGNLYNSGIISLPYFEADSTIALSLLFPSVVFTYLSAKHHKIGTIIEELKLSRGALNRRAVSIGILLFAAIFVLGIAFSLFQTITHIPLPTNVGLVLKGMPLYLLIFAVVVAPINEEILFRGFLVPRIGIISSALIFALFHISYASISEFAAAFIFGLIAGYALKKTKSLYTTIIGHALVNLLTILILIT